MNNFFNCDYKKHVFNIYILSHPVVAAMTLLSTAPNPLKLNSPPCLITTHSIGDQFYRFEILLALIESLIFINICYPNVFQCFFFSCTKIPLYWRKLSAVRQLRILSRFLLEGALSRCNAEFLLEGPNRTSHDH